MARMACREYLDPRSIQIVIPCNAVFAERFCVVKIIPQVETTNIVASGFAIDWNSWHRSSVSTV